MRKFHFTIFLLFITALGLKAQLYYYRADSLQVSEGGQTFTFPFQGGFNAPQFNGIDLNQDNTMDLVIFDRSGQKISTYLNVGSAGQIAYQYAPEYESAFPEISDWLFCRDYNCDGKMDLITGVRGSSVRVYENVSTANNLSFTYISQIRSTYYGNSFSLNINPGGANLPGVGDMNNDGDIDFVFFDQNGSQMEFHKNISVDSTGNCGLIFEERSECWGDFTEAGFNSTIFLDSCRFGNSIPNAESSGDLIRNLENKIRNNNKDNKHAGSSVAMVDLERSGNMDLVIGDVGGSNLTALINGDSVSPYVNSHIVSKDTAFPSYNVPVDLPVFPAAFFLDVNNDQKEDMLVSTNSNGYLARSKYRDNIYYYENTGTNQNRYTYRNNNFLQGDVIDLGRGAYPAFLDYNQDGLMDLLVGNDGYLDTALNEMVGQLALFENVGTMAKAEYQLVDRDFGGISNIPLDLTTNGPQRFLVPAVGDLDNDGDADLLIGDDDGRIHYFKDNSASGSNANFVLQNAAFQKLNVFNRAAPALYDVNGDNKLDLIIGNSLGDLQYHQNLGSPSSPIFNLEVQSITWQYDSILRYQLRGNPDLSAFQIGQQLDINEALNGDNNVFQLIANIDNSQNYIDLIHPFTRSSIDDEPNSTAVIDYSVKQWGGVDLTNFNFDANAVPFLYRNTYGEINMVIGSQSGYLYFYNQIDSNITSGNFNLVDSVYTSLRLGANTSVSGADLNQDSLIDLAIGNEAGGFTILMASGRFGRDSIGNPIDTTGNDTTGADTNAISVREIAPIEGQISIYPNPSSEEFFVQVPSSISLYDIRIIDLNGRIVYSRQNNIQAKLRIDHQLRSGIYLVEIKSSEQRLTAKMMIKPH